MIIKDNTGKTVSETSTLMAYFGKAPGQNLSDFMAECKALSSESKTELAVGAAKELGWSVIED